MNLAISAFDAAIVIAFLAATLLIGLRLPRHDQSPSGYLLGGRALTLPAFVATTVSTWYGGILGIGEYTWRYGISNWIVFGIPYYVGALFFALIISRRARASNALTLPTRFEQFYGRGPARCAAIIIFLTTVPGAYVLMMGTLFSLGLNMPLWCGIAITALFVVLYLWRGGFSAVARTDAIQFALMFGSFIILSAILAFTYGLEPLASLPPSHLEPSGGQSTGAILVWYLIAMSTLAEPNFYQRCFAAKTPQIARRGLIISIVCWLIFDLMTTFCGLYARALLPDLQNPVHAFPALANTVLPTGLVGLFYAGLFATVLSSLDSNLFTTATTLGRDLWPDKCTPTWSISTKTRIGLILGAALAATIALASGSIIELWKVFGSVSAAALLIPILSTYFPQKLPLSPRTALVLMIASATTTLLWFLSKKITGSYWLNIEPLFAGGSVAILCLISSAAFIALKKRATRTSTTK